MVARHIPSLKRTRFSQARGIKQRAFWKICGKRFLQQLNHELFNDLLSIVNFLIVIITALNKKSLKDVADVLHD